MGVLNYSARGNTQPQIALDTNPDLGLTYLLIPSLNMDLIKKYAPNYVGSARSPGVGGYAVVHDSTTDYTTLAADDASIVPLNTCTIFLYIKKITSDTGGEFGESTNGVVANRCGAHLPYTDTNVYWDFGGVTAGVNRLVATAPVVGTDIWAFTTGPGGMGIVQNGKLIASNSANPTRTTGNSAFRLGGQNTSAITNSSSFEVYAFGVSNKQLDIGTLCALTSSPESMVNMLFRKPSRRFFTIDGAVSPTVISLTLAAFNLTPKSEQLNLTNQLSAASVVFVPKSQQLAVKNNLSSANLKLTPQSPQLSLVNRLTAASLVFVGKALDITNIAAGTVVSLTTASLNFVAQPVQNKLNTNLALAALNFSAKQTTNSLALRLTAGALNFAAQPTSNTLRVVLNTAVLRFTTGALTVTGAIDSILNRLRVMMGIGQ